MTFGRSQSDLSTNGESMCAAVDFRARTYPSRARAPVFPVSGRASGSRCSESFASYDPDSCSWRTSQGCLTGGLEPFSEGWPRAGMTRSGSAFRQRPLVPRTPGIASGSWPTPNAAKAGNDVGLRCSGDGRSRPNKLGWAVAERMLPTPTASGFEVADVPRLLARREACKLKHKNGNGFGLTLAQAIKVQMFRTPNSRDWKGMSAKSWRERTKGDNTPTLPDQIGGQLNPTWVEWLMGYPAEWTALED